MANRLGLLAMGVIAVLGGPAAAQKAGGYSPVTPEPPPATQPARPYETVVRASPMWTQDRNFLGTRFWKLDKGHYEAEVWYRGAFYGDDPSEHITQLELMIGLTRRLQLDLYEILISDVDPGGERTFRHEGNAIELRIAIPEQYGVMWGNPVIYLEWRPRHDAPDRAEARLLVGGELFTPKLLGAANLVFECNADSMRGEPYRGEPEFGVTAAASYEVLARRLRLGAETRIIFEREDFANADTEVEVMLGPNLDWHILGERLKLYATVFFGLTEDGPRIAPWIILGSGW